MIGNFGQIQYRIIEGKINYGKLLSYKNENQKQIENPQLSDSKLKMEKTLSDEMKRLSIKYFKGREYNQEQVTNWNSEYIDDMRNFVKSNFPNYKFFFCVCSQKNNQNSFYINNKQFYFTYTDGFVKYIYIDKIYCASYLLYIKTKNKEVDVSFKGLENYLQPKIKKIFYNYLEGRKYDHKEFDFYVEGIGEEIRRETKNFSKNLSSNFITILIKKPSYNYNFTWNWLNGNNTHKIFEKYNGQYSECKVIIASCIP